MDSGVKGAFLLMVFFFSSGILVGAFLVYPVAGKSALGYLGSTPFDVRISPAALALLIFTNNVKVVLLIVLSALAVIGPPLIVFLNGVIVGAVSMYAVERTSIVTLLLSLTPHGVIEVPAILYVSARSYAFGISVWKEILHKSRGNTHTHALELVRALLVTIVLLFIAAVIEAFVTPRIAGIDYVFKP